MESPDTGGQRGRQLRDEQQFTRAEIERAHRPTVAQINIVSI